MPAGDFRGRGDVGLGCEVPPHQKTIDEELPDGGHPTYDDEGDAVGAVHAVPSIPAPAQDPQTIEEGGDDERATQSFQGGPAHYA